eukprot:5766307-Pyramimonas_sp.AAC.1
MADVASATSSLAPHSVAEIISEICSSVTSSAFWSGSSAPKAPSPNAALTKSFASGSEGLRRAEGEAGRGQERSGGDNWRVLGKIVRTTERQRDREKDRMTKITTSTAQTTLIADERTTHDMLRDNTNTPMMEAT